MEEAPTKRRRCILGVFAHPDDETSSSAGTFVRYAREGVDIYVATATRGERGTLGTGGVVIDRRELPAVREAELRTVLEMVGGHPPVFLDYRDQELSAADFEEVVGRVLSVMEEVRPDRVITFGPSGISNHDDHVMIHRAALEAFKRYAASNDTEPRLFYVALPEEVAKRFELELHPLEASPTVIVDIREHKALKIEALRSYRSQEDAQVLADMGESSDFDVEAYHQVLPPAADGQVSDGFWER